MNSLAFLRYQHNLKEQKCQMLKVVMNYDLMI